MTPEIAITLISLLVALVLFGTEKLPVDVVGIILVIGLVLTGVLTVNEGVAGFGDNVIVTIAGLFVLTGNCNNRVIAKTRNTFVDRQYTR